MPSHGGVVFCRRYVSPACLSRGRRSDPPACVPFRRRDPLTREFFERQAKRSARMRSVQKTRPSPVRIFRAGGGDFYAASRTRACAKKFCAGACFFARKTVCSAVFAYRYANFAPRRKPLALGAKKFCLFFSSVRKRGECGVHIRVTGGRKAPQTNENPGGEKNVKKAERKIREKAPSGCPLRHKKEKEK